MNATPRYPTRQIKARKILPGNMIVTPLNRLDGVISVAPCDTDRANVHITTNNAGEACYYGDTFLTIKNP
jgi:hypothetical protein